MAARAADGWMLLPTRERIWRLDAATESFVAPSDDRLCDENWIDLLIGHEIETACSDMLIDAGIPMQSAPDIMA
jgi:hypothetical protein